MTARSIIVAVALGVVGAAGLWWWQQQPPSVVPGGVVPGSDPPADAGLEDSSETPITLGDPEAFRDRMRAFVETGDAMPAAERQSRADTLRADILARERSGDLLPGESAYLQLALLRTTISDEARLQAASQALLDEYQARSDAGWQAYREQPDIRHQAYRAAEAELVRRAAADGDEPLSQDELRRRLQSLREQYYGDEPLQ